MPDASRPPSATNAHQTHSLIVGLTGGIGSGKSTVEALFNALGVPSVDADVIARAIVAPGTPCLSAIAQYVNTQYNDDVLLADGSLNRAKLRELIFSDASAKRWLEQLLHPAIRQQLLQQLAQAQGPYVVLVAPLLLENGLDALCQQVLVVDVPENLQQQRTQARDAISEQQVNAILAAQLSRQQRLAKATDVIDNSGSPAALNARVAALHQKYLQLNTLTRVG